MIEIPSHLAELFLKDYRFVRKFATVLESTPLPDDNENPIEKLEKQF